MYEIVKDFVISPLSGLIILLLVLCFLGIKKYIERVAENLADLHTKEWKQ